VRKSVGTWGEAFEIWVVAALLCADPTCGIVDEQTIT
jgi:hypothetical protein